MGQAVGVYWCGSALVNSRASSRFDSEHATATNDQHEGDTAMKYPQYAKTTAPDVIGVIEENKRGQQEVREKALAFAKKHGGEDAGFRYSSFLGYRVTAIDCDEKPTSGRWKAGGRGYGYAPYKNNPLYAEFEQLAYTPKPIRGTPDLLHGEYNADGSQRVGGPTLFVLNGVAYSGTALTPVDAMPDGSPWEEIKASEFHAAMETYNARLQQVG